MINILDRFRLDGKVAVVTGASRGLGQAMALALAEAGASVMSVARGDCTGTDARIRQLGRESATLKIDLAAPGAAGTVVNRTVYAMGRLIFWSTMRASFAAHRSSILTRRIGTM